MNSLAILRSITRSPAPVRHQAPNGDWNTWERPDTHRFQGRDSRLTIRHRVVGNNDRVRPSRRLARHSGPCRGLPILQDHALASGPRVWLRAFSPGSTTCGRWQSERRRHHKATDEVRRMSPVILILSGDGSACWYASQQSLLLTVPSGSVVLHSFAFITARVTAFLPATPSV